MKLAIWSPSYSLKEVHLYNQKDHILVGIDDKSIKLKPNEINNIILGEVNSFLKDYSSIGRVVESTVELLDALTELEGISLGVVKYSQLENGKQLIGDLSEFEAKEYISNCRNPAIDTSIIEDNKDKRIIIVSGLLSDKNILPFVSSLIAYRDTKNLSKLEQLIVVDSCVGTIGDNAKERDQWAKYSMEIEGAIISSIYLGDTKIS